MAEATAAGTPRERFEGAVVAFLTCARNQPAGFAVLTHDSPIVARTGLNRFIDDLTVRIDDMVRAEFKRAGFSVKVAPIFFNALLGTVTQVGLGELARATISPSSKWRDT